MRVLIVEDEAPAARRLERMTADHFGAKLKAVASADTIPRARAALASASFDLILLDLDLNGADGFEVLKGMDESPKVIVVSARIDRAIDAFDNAVVDFVPKPVAPDRLARAFERAAEAPAGRGLNLVVRASGRIHMVPLARVASLSGADDYVEVALTDGRRFLHDVSLDRLEARLPPDFVRVHRSHIVNLAHLQSVEKSGGQIAALLAGGQRIAVSRRRAPVLNAALARRTVDGR